jgi:hypothetical protein
MIAYILILDKPVFKISAAGGKNKHVLIQRLEHNLEVNASFKQ